LSLARRGDGNYALANTDLDGDVAVDYFHVQGLNEPITRVGVMGRYPAAATETRLVPLPLGAVVLAVREQGVLSLVPMEWDKRFDDANGITDYFKLGVADAGPLASFDVAGLVPNKAAGDVVVAGRGSGKLQLGVWRIGARP
jgi:hypothetical protein